MACLTDYVEISDMDKDGKKSIHTQRHCNTFRPPDIIESSWNHMQITFISDFHSHPSNGFLGRYESLKYSIPENLEWKDNYIGKL